MEDEMRSVSRDESGQRLIKFSDGMDFHVGGDYRTVYRRDGWYVVGHGMLIPVRDEKEGKTVIADLNT